MPEPLDVETIRRRRAIALHLIENPRRRSSALLTTLRESAEDVAVLLAEVDRLRAERDKPEETASHA